MWYGPIQTLLLLLNIQFWHLAARFGSLIQIVIGNYIPPNLTIAQSIF